MKPTYDVVVVGSGFGGAITGCRLAQAGRSVCILERGRNWEKTDFPRSPREVAKSFWIAGQNLGFLEYKAFKRIDVIQGCGVGGGSLHYFNVHLRTPAEIFSQKSWPAEITRSVLDPYYDCAEKMLESKPLTPPEGLELPRRTKTFFQAVEAARWNSKLNPELVPIGVYTGKDRTNPYSGIPQTACNYQGNCLLGCNIHSKNTLDLNYIPVAERNGAEVFPLHAVDKIEPLPAGGYRVHFQRLDAADPKRSEPGSVAGKAVVLAAGTLGTNELLLRCRNVYRTLPNLSPLLGTRFSGNGDFILAGTFADRRYEVDPARGPSITAKVHTRTKNNMICIEDLGYPEPFIWLLEGAIPSSRRLNNLLKAAWTYFLDSIGLGTGRISFEVDRLFRGGDTTSFLPYLGMGTDAADGRLYLRNGSIDIRWSHRHSRRLFREMEQLLKQLSRSLDGTYVTSILWRWPIRKLLTAHPLGGCFMGSKPENSVVKHTGEAWGYPNLYTADASIIPSALAVNPSLTISALAERVAFLMIHHREMRPGESPEGK